MTIWLRVRVMARLTLLQACWEPALMQAAGLSYALDPWLVRCWRAEPEALRRARIRQLEHFNTHPYAAWLIAGGLSRLEEEAATRTGAERAAALRRIRALRGPSACALAGLYDSFFWGALRPASAAAGVAALLAAQRLGLSCPAAFAVAAALALYNGPGLVVRCWGFVAGGADGERVVLRLARVPAQNWIRALRWTAAAGALLAFGLAATRPGVSPADRLAAALTFTGGLALSARGIAPLTQAGGVGLAVLVAAAAGLWP